MNQRPQESGYSLIEVLIATSLLLIIMFGMYQFQKSVFSINLSLSESLTSQREARSLMQRISGELRSASPSSTGSYPLEQVGTTSIIFFTNIDNDALKERMRYFVSGTTLKRGITKPSGNPLAYNLGSEIVTDQVHNVLATSSIFFYYDTNYAGTSSPMAQPVNIAGVRLIKIQIQMDANPAKPPEALSFTTQIMMRNLKDNL